MAKKQKVKFMKEIFYTPVEMFEYINTFKDFLVSIRIKVMGAPYSIKYINPKYTILENGKFLKIEADNIESAQILPLFLVEEIKIKWVLFNRRAGQRMVTDTGYFKQIMIPEIRIVLDEYYKLKV